MEFTKQEKSALEWLFIKGMEITNSDKKYEVFDKMYERLVNNLPISDVIKPLPLVEEGEKLEYCCLGFPNDWYDIPVGITNMKHFDPLKIRKRKPNGETETVYDTTK
ncbi:hypothetical protein FORMB_19040 [Formosa sp. Hel1_33_131]|uniref:hypothetical protein n=1 Tax=Formosa sp. Hel1_33_131 TaxID=1336794 RepID=UPI00084E2D2E|nr:hypothetical protein [Formosa sp. Hel1_33_131]AOR28934.1 hypothetical protein FORMB_19040 [Formosa sp. Hel1_33_131]